MFEAGFDANVAAVRFNDAADDGQAKSGALGFRRVETAVKARFCNSSLMPLPVSLNSTETCVGFSLVRGERTRPGFDGERAALRHRFGGIENQIQKGLFQLRRIRP